MSDSESEIAVSIPLDDGFLRRECPSCLRQFKWWHGEHPDRPEGIEDGSEYYCPYCRATAGPQSWYTQPQIDLIQNRAGLYATQHIHEALASSISGLNRSGFIQAELTGGTTSEMLPLDEPHDMVEAASPCHPWEPIKYEESWTKALYCLVCGEPFEPARE